jgi:hypothetical protein
MMWMTVPFGGGGRTIMGVMAREAAAGALGTIALGVPQIAVARGARGEEMTFGEAAAITAIGGVFGGTVGALGFGIGRAIEVRRNNRAAAQMLGREQLGDVSDAELVAAIRDAVPAEQQSPELRAALSVLERDSEVAAASPYVDSVEGMDAHAARLAETMRTLTEGGRVGARMHSDPPASPGGRSRRQADVAGAASDNYYDRLAQIESSGNPNAQASTSSAAGLFQFTEGTFRQTYRQVFGGSDAQARAAWQNRRFDPALQRQLAERLTANNDAMLRNIGAPVTDGNRYLGHFLGSGGAARILRAGRDTPVSQLLPAAAIRANRSILEGRTAGQVIDWAASRMAGSAQRGAGGAAAPAAPIEAAPPPVRPAAMDAERPVVEGPPRDVTDYVDRYLAGEGRAAEDPQPVSPILDRDAFPDEASYQVALAVDSGMVGARAPSPTLDASVAALRTAVADRGQRLGNIEALSRRLGIEQDEMRAAIARLARDGELVVRGVPRRLANDVEVLEAALQGGARFARPPQRTRPLDAYQLIASMGGVRDDLSLRGRSANDLGQRLATRNFQPGFGPVVRRNGRLSLDEVGELLWERGFLRAQDEAGTGLTDRPTIAQVLDYLESGLDNPRLLLALDDVGREAELRAASADTVLEIDEWASVSGYNLTSDDIAEIAAIYDRSFEDGAPVSFDDALAISYNRKAMDALYDAWQEVGDDPDYAAGFFRLADDGLDEGIDGSSPVGRDAGEGSGSLADAAERAAEASRWERFGDTSQLDDAELDQALADGWGGPIFDSDPLNARFDSVDGDGLARTADSMWHDIDVDIAARAGDDAVPDIMAERIDIDDGAGPRTVADIRNEIDADLAAIEAARRCL